MNSNTIWGRIREGLRNHYGDPIDRSWFSKLEPTEDADAKELSLKASSGFICSYIQQHYLHTIEKYCQDENYRLLNIH